MADGLDIDAMLDRFRMRAEAVRARQVPPVEGEARKAFIEQSRLDFMDFAMMADAQAELVDGVLTLRVDLRPKS
ncbi:MAG: hypothetical protein U0Q22_18725 [Acidimicrobiales bacterium]